MKFSFFEVDKIENPDIILNIGKFTPSCKYCYSVDHKYIIKKNYLYCKESEGVADWQIQITGLEEGPIIIHYNGKIKGIASLVNPDFLAQNFLLKIIEYKLYQKGYYLVHAGGISRDGEGYLLPGRGGSFKTTLCMDLIRKKGFKLLGDDRVLIGNGLAYSFPMSFPVFSYMFQHLNHEDAWNITHKLSLIRQLINNRLFVDAGICEHEPAKIAGLIFINRANITKLVMQQLSGNETVKKLILNNRMEDYIDISFLNITSGPFLRYFLAYSYIFPESQIAQFVNGETFSHPEITRNFDSLTFCNVTIPKTYNDQVANQLNDMISRHGTA
jgi:hypothetical protein